MLSSASKYDSIKSAEECLHIINNTDRLNRIKGITNMESILSLFKYQSRFYIVQRNNYSNHRGMTFIWNNKLFPSLNVIHGK